MRLRRRASNPLRYILRAIFTTATSIEVGANPRAYSAARGREIADPARHGPTSSGTRRAARTTRRAWIVDGAAVGAGTRIPIERFTGPIFISVGESDEVWPADQTRLIEATLRNFGREPEVHYFPCAAHIFGYLDENRRRALVLAFLKRQS
ncbi:MAG: hypothetical protein FJW38_15270 [Acidobacteria bacterium]|nr:hypothetical protein [Acidobacteriota bacterium]